MKKNYCTRMPRFGMWLSLMVLLPSTSHAMGMVDGQGMGMMGNSSPRYVYVMRHGLDSNYARMIDSLPSSAENIKTGKRYTNKIASPVTAKRDVAMGWPARASPPSADLARLAKMPIASDGYVHWAIAEGGAAFNIAIPAMKSVLSEPEIWKLVLYLRSF